MPYKISGTLGQNSRIIVIKESDWSIESNTVENAGAYEVDTLASGTKTIIAIAINPFDGESDGFGNVTPVYY